MRPLSDKEKEEREKKERERREKQEKRFRELIKKIKEGQYKLNRGILAIPVGFGGFAGGTVNHTLPNNVIVAREQTGAHKHHQSIEITHSKDEANHTSLTAKSVRRHIATRLGVPDVVNDAELFEVPIPIGDTPLTLKFESDLSITNKPYHIIHIKDGKISPEDLGKAFPSIPADEINNEMYLIKDLPSLGITEGNVKISAESPTKISAEVEVLKCKVGKKEFKYVDGEDSVQFVITYDINIANKILAQIPESVPVLKKIPEPLPTEDEEHVAYELLTDMLHVAVYEYVVRTAFNNNTNQQNDINSQRTDPQD